MPLTCRECGALLPEGGACVELFHALLLLEQEVMRDGEATAEGRGELAHFYAVSTYMLQHPESMGCKAEALAGVRKAIAEHLSGRMSPARWRQVVRRTLNGPARVVRRPGDEVVRWAVLAWPMTVADVLAGGPQGYLEGVSAWAASVVQAIDANGA